MQRLLIPRLLLAAALLAPLTGTLHAQSPTAGRTPAATMAAWMAAYNAPDSTALVALYDPNAVLLPAGDTLMRGLAAVRSRLASGLGPAEMILTVADSATRGDLHVSSGPFRVRARGDTGAGRAGTWVFVMRQQPDGRWLITLTQWGTVRAAAPAPARAPAGGR